MPEKCIYTSFKLSNETLREQNKSKTRIFEHFPIQLSDFC